MNGGHNCSRRKTAWETIMMKGGKTVLILLLTAEGDSDRFLRATFDPLVPFHKPQK